MSEIFEQRLSDAFSYLLTGLCVDQFPCGNGKWRSGNKWRCDSPDLLNPSKDTDADLESIQTLQEISKLEPFTIKTDWSEDIGKIRKLAIENPEGITKGNIYKYFSKLRLVDLNIIDVDEGLLKFSNLKELTLSANKIREIYSNNLPKGLEVLELYGNHLSDINTLPRSLPSLTHLGVGKNALPTIIGSIPPNTWSNMLSLDFSFNSLSGLRETLNALTNLPTLNNLLLQGNPLFLSSCYRGLVVDTLKQLNILDDVRITADEKHRYKATSKLKGLSADDAVIEINLSALKGIRAVQETENENGEEFPKAERRYQICYPFLYDSTVRKEKKESDSVKGKDKDTPESGAEAEERASASETEDELLFVDTALCKEDDYLLKRKTKEKKWCEDEIIIGHERTFITSDLINLKRFMSEGIVFQVIENKLLVSLDPPEDSFSIAGDGDAGENSKRGKSAKSKKRIASAKEKPKQPPPSKQRGSGKGRKKAKGEELPVFELSRDSKIIAETCLSLEDFKHSAKLAEKQCILTPTESPESEVEAPQEDCKESKFSKKPSSAAAKKTGKESRRPSAANTNTTQGNKSSMGTKHGKGDKTDSKTKTKENKHLTEIAEFDSQEPPPPITLDVTVCLRSWHTAKEVQDWIHLTTD
eukprot:Seg2294.8 transcript_id=Seg2294.8/GoldUCD/mRNA.D3Y31 product="Leucine-rich repeat-containing protein 43" protein_id=Seg2294.8/GoldUCD/D3Y31